MPCSLSHACRLSLSVPAHAPTSPSTAARAAAVLLRAVPAPRVCIVTARHRHRPQVASSTAWPCSPCCLGCSPPSSHQQLSSTASAAPRPRWPHAVSATPPGSLPALLPCSAKAPSHSQSPLRSLSPPSGASRSHLHPARFVPPARTPCCIALRLPGTRPTIRAPASGSASASGRTLTDSAPAASPLPGASPAAQIIVTRLFHRARRPHPDDGLVRNNTTSKCAATRPTASSACVMHVCRRRHRLAARLAALPSTSPFCVSLALRTRHMSARICSSPAS